MLHCLEIIVCAFCKCTSAFILHLRGTCVKGKAKVQIYIIQKSIMEFH